MLKRFLSVILITTIMLTMSNYIFLNKKYVNAVNSPGTEVNLPGTYEIIEESKNYAFIFNRDTMEISILDKEIGYIWRSFADETMVNMENMADLWKNCMNSLLVLSYTDTEKDDGRILKAYSNNQKQNTNIEKISNGISMRIFFEAIEIEIRVDFRFTENTLTVDIPFEGVKEEEKYALIKVELMPFFGASNRDIDGYIFVPDGCGVLVDYKKSQFWGTNAKLHKWYVYGPLIPKYESYEEIDDELRFEASLPVFGIKNNNNAVLAMITQGDADSAINLEPEGYAVNLNRVFFEFNYRNSYSILLSNIKVKGSSLAQRPVALKFEKDIIRKDYSVRYTFLNKEEADYSGMANSCREYYIKTGVLNDNTSIKNTTIPLALDLFMGTIEERLILKKYINMTTFDQAKTILTELNNMGINEINVKLVGWMKGGYGAYPNNWPPEKRLGGINGLKKLAEYIGTTNMNLYLQTDFVYANSKNRGFSKKNDVVRQGNKRQVTDEKDEWFLMNPKVVYDRSKNLIRNIINGVGSCYIGYDRIGKIIYKDYNAKNPSDREQTADTWEDLLSYTNENMGKVAVEGSNIYAAKHANWLYNIPTKSSNYYISEEDIPFYQMVVHGHVYYSSTPGNLFYDSGKQKLKWIEYGCAPYYELTFNSAKLLKYTDNNTLFTSHYGKWIDEIKEMYEEFNSSFGDFWNTHIKGHYKIDDNVYKVEYENESTIYINYNKKEVLCDGYLINALDYLVVRK